MTTKKWIIVFIGCTIIWLGLKIAAEGQKAQIREHYRIERAR